MDELNLKKPVFLCGMMGSGKSTAGRILASELDVPFLDLDEMIVEKSKMSIPDIFDQKGESWFREMERSILIRETQNFSGVMALGGGSLQNQHIVDHLKIYGWLVFLDVPQSVILSRVSGDSNRPILNNENTNNAVRSKVESLLEERLPLYQQAEITIDAGNRTVENIAKEIIKKLTHNDGFNRR